MKIGHLKGAILEYSIRELLKNCGFTNSKADNLFTYENNGLFYINGKGSAHDADVIMNPPIQMPFAYPTQLIFECKAYKESVKLYQVRNVLGLREDINSFEIVTRETLNERRNNTRKHYAIDSRIRYTFQVGLASINDFTKPVVEYASNNKIPLISLKWLLGTDAINILNEINDGYLANIEEDKLKNLYKFLKDRNSNLNHEKYILSKNFINEPNNEIASIIRLIDDAIKYSYVGLLETGDIVFLFAEDSDNVLNEQNIETSNLAIFNSEIHWYNDKPNVWELKIRKERQPDRFSTFRFYVPDRIFNLWNKFNLSKEKAIDLKGEYFSKIFVFNQNMNPKVPFSIVYLDQYWLSKAKERLTNDIIVDND